MAIFQSLKVLKDNTRHYLELEPGDQIKLEEIQKGGSERRFFRASFRLRAGSVILMEYSDAREENHYYAPIARFLRELRVPAPQIRAHCQPQRLIWMDDLGDVSLYDVRGRPWEHRRALYRAVLEAVVPLYGEGRTKARQIGLPMMPGFGPELYRWEREYFAEHYLKGACRCKPEEVEWQEVEAELEGSAAELAAQPEVLVHRDLQSQNIMVGGDHIHLIDFQGMRPGCLYYDLASLIYDPYAWLTGEQQDDLMADAQGMGWGPAAATGEFRRLLMMAGVQRLMQALGAYGNLGLRLGKTDFLRHIDPAEAILRRLAHELKLAKLGRLLQRAAEKRGAVRRD